MATIQGVYVALFGRPADPLGLAYWKGVTNDGANLSLIGDLAQVPEYQDRFAGQSDAQVVNSIYQTLFGRSADVAGLTYWVQGLQSGEFTINDVAIRILDGAQGADKTRVENKIAAADLFTASLDTADEILAYEGNAAADFGRAFLAGVTTTVPTEEEVEAVVSDLVTEGPGLIGDTFTLTTAADTFVGTAGNDTFQAKAGGDLADRTLNQFDSVDGGAGVDTMNIIARGTADVAVPTGATVKNVEIINVLNEGNNNVVASGFQGAQQVWQIGGAGNITGLAAGTTAGFRNTAVNDIIAAAAGVAAVSVALDNVAVASTLNVDGAAVNTLSVSGSISKAGVAPGAYADLALDISNDTAATNANITTLNLALTSNTDLSIDAAGATELVTVDASQSTGGIRINLIGVAADALDLASVTLGSGNDRVLFNNVASDADEVSFDFGAGNDEIVVGLQATGDTALTITTGAGDDVITLQGGNVNVNADEDGFDGSVTITDFSAASDSLLVEAFDGFTAQNLVNNAIAGAESLYDAVEAIQTILENGGTNITSFAKFSFDGNTYLYGNVEAAGLDGDLLVGFTGAVDLNNNNVAEFGTI
ncbi:DUF4214 domain-containing protein [Devosia sp. SD17-2]|uniref:DUF4214 domain-containing protein n=1 Tax=Devosia sp. SD17-2 TaxID=2976459 RepID=UPI0023D88987|nr:DUF4214 domain-containing protein [Devosia sp. SD17-2]WEJ33840.1 DUF4214 domain-containing protein [Devosia sp. SD17-2]